MTTAAHPTLASGPSTNRGATLVVSSLTVAGRTIKKFVRSPQLIVTGTVTGAMFLIIFRYVFGGAIAHTGTLPYVDFVVPGYVVTGVLFSGMGAAAGIADDLQIGLYDRLRSLPISPLSIIGGRALADTAMVVWGLAVTTAIGFAVGFRVHGGVADALGAFGLCALFGFAFCWLFITLGLVAGSPQAAQSLAFLVFPLTFVSSAYVPVSTMPGWMQPVAAHQPITSMTDAVRVLAEGHGAQLLVGQSLAVDVLTAVAWSAGLILVFAPLAVLRLRRR